MTSPFSVLVLCTGNSARSILGEAILNELGAGRVAAHSAGSKPKGQPHPGALRLLARRGIDTSPFRSKSWNDFTASDAQPIDLAITVCGNAAGEACPVFFGARSKRTGACPTRRTSPEVTMRWTRPLKRPGACWKCGCAHSWHCRSKPWTALP